MIRKRKLVFLSAIIITIFLIVTTINYVSLTMMTIHRQDNQSFSDELNYYLDNLPELYKKQHPLKYNVFDKKFLGYIRKTDALKELWNLSNSWVSKNHLVDLENSFVGSTIWALKNAKIIKADLDNRGTQLKLLLTLQGGQSAIFKPKWYDIETVINGPVYAGKDRYNSEIVGFYLSIILNSPRTPISVERTISLSHEIMPVATRNLLNTSFEQENRVCLYGKCFYCKKDEAICEDRNFHMHGALIFNINATFKSFKSPWQRTYKKDKKALWEKDANYCKLVREKISKRRLLDLIDTSIFDFLIQNGDRHHYETLFDNVVWIDNGKGFGNPSFTHLDILAPLYQCCILRTLTMNKLLNLAGGAFRQKLMTIPDIHNLITTTHLNSMENRLLMVFATIEFCKRKNVNIFV